MRGITNYAEEQDSLRKAGDISSKFYLRFMLIDRPGAMGILATALGKYGVSISALSQKDVNGEGEPVPVVAMTHMAKTSNLDEALAEIAKSGVISEEPVKLRVL